MVLESSEAFQHICLVVCTLGTIVLGGQCLMKYLADEDVSNNSIKNFHHKDLNSIHPSVSICIMNPYLPNELQRFGKDIDVPSYIKFLSGHFWDNRLYEIDYDNVTISLENSLIMIEQVLRNGTKFTYHHVNISQQTKGWKPKYYVSLREVQRKCRHSLRREWSRVLF